MIMILTGGARGEHPLFVSLENRESIGLHFLYLKQMKILKSGVPHNGMSMCPTSISRCGAHRFYSVFCIVTTLSPSSKLCCTL